MRIIIVQAEIEAAIEQYVRSQVDIKEGQEITIDFKATRGEDGATAEINIAAAGTATVAPVATPVRRGRPPAATKTEETTQEATESVTESQTVEDTSTDENAVVEQSMEADGPTEAAKEEAEVTEGQTVEAVQEPEAAAAPKTGSLFASMRNKPVSNG